MREIRCELLDLCPHGVRRGKGIGARCQLDADPGGRLPVILRIGEVVFGAKRDARNVAQPHLRAVGLDLQQDVLEIGRCMQQRCFGDRRGQTLCRRRRGAAQLAAGDLNVLTLDRARNVHRCQREAIELVRIEPDAHRILRAEQVEISDPVDAA